MPTFDPGPTKAPFIGLCSTYPGPPAYPQSDFRTEWGPIFHRGRLDGSARVLVIGQDPGPHEAVLRRILVGEAGRRVQGFLAKLGIDESYVMINAFLYSVYGQGTTKFVDDAPIAQYRNQWIDALLAPGKVQAVVTFGTLARKSWELWKATPAGASSTLPAQHLTHPTQPESAGNTKAEREQLTQALLAGWNAGLTALRPAITQPDRPMPNDLYGTAFTPADKAEIPSFDLPAGVPAWMYANDGWARRIGETPAEKRANITITVPKPMLPP